MMEKLLLYPIFLLFLFLIPQKFWESLENKWKILKKSIHNKNSVKQAQILIEKLGRSEQSNRFYRKTPLPCYKFYTSLIETV
ncbi:MAG: hypothetical protein OXB84_03335, partial [Halobacteriovoraceae bacterium]|nr:hypothetical protein [Halobacteriovoraceae bacterium]